MHAPLVTVIIPAYNAESTIGRAVSSVLGQTYANVEAIVVDDASADVTCDVVRMVAAADARVTLLCHDANRKQLEARRTGAFAARGEFILFLDADDELKPDMAERLVAGQDGRHDIVQCSFETRYERYASRYDRRFDRAFTRAPQAIAQGDEITHLVFRERRTTWSLCGKLMRAEIVRQAFDHVPPTALAQAEDACLFFMISCLADSYRGLGAYEGYVYNIDAGSSDARWRTMSLEQFAGSCRYSDAMAIIGDFLEETGRADAFGDDYRITRYEHVRAVADKLARYVAPADRAPAFDALLRKWKPTEAVAALSEVCWNDPAGCLDAVAGADALRCAHREVKTVAAYSYSMGIGGAERVAAELVGTWKRMGYDVVLFSDEARSDCRYDLPDDVAWVQLPKTDAVKPGGYAARAEAIADAVSAHHVDAFVHHQWWNRLLVWDALLLKSLGVPVCMFCHSVFQMFFHEAYTLEFDYSRVMRHLDALVVLSEADRRFWSKFNPRVFVTANPATIAPSPGLLPDPGNRDVVWVGRMTKSDKQPHEAIEVFARVAAERPDCRLVMVGPAPSAFALAELKGLARRLGVADRVDFAGPTDDVASFYRRAAVFLLTSRLDGWCLTLAEAKACGLPCVMYEMDYLTLAQGHRGIVAVPQGDRDAAARAVCGLLDDPERRAALGGDAAAHMEEVAAFDFEGFWTRVFGQLAEGSPDRGALAENDAEWNLLIDAFKESVEKSVDLPVPNYAYHKGMKTARALWRRIRG